jgi:CDP-glycerol glycerophosphotransferase (TagB/SpsB family)
MRPLCVAHIYNNIIIILKPDASISNNISKFESKYYKKDAVVKYI